MWFSDGLQKTYIHNTTKNHTETHDSKGPVEVSGNDDLIVAVENRTVRNDNSVFGLELSFIVLRQVSIDECVCGREDTRVFFKYFACEKDVFARKVLVVHNKACDSIYFVEGITRRRFVVIVDHDQSTRKYLQDKER